MTTQPTATPDRTEQPRRTCCIPGCPEPGPNTATFTAGAGELELYITFPSDGTEHLAHHGRPICPRHSEEASTGFETLALLDGGSGEAVHTSPTGTVHTAWDGGLPTRR